MAASSQTEVNVIWIASAPRSRSSQQFHTRRPYELMYNTDVQNNRQEMCQCGQDTPHKRRKQTTRTIVATNEAVAVLVLQLSIHVLLCLFHRNVHEAIQTSQDAWTPSQTAASHSKSELTLMRGCS